MKALIIYFFSLNLYAATNISVEDIPKLILEKNHKVLSGKYELDAIKAHNGHLKRSFLPSVELQASQEHFKKGLNEKKTQPSYGLGLNFNIYNGGQDQIKDQSILYALEGRNALNNVDRIEETVKAYRLYWNAVFFKNYLDLLQDFEKNQKKNLQSIKRRIDSGLTTKTDQIDFEISEAERKNELMNAKLNYELVLSELSLVLGLEVKDIVLSDKLIHQHDWEENIQIKVNAVDKFIAHDISENKQNEAIANSKERYWWPKLDLYLGYNQFNQREEEDYSRRKEREETVIGLKISMNLFDGLTSKKEATAIRYQIKAQELTNDYRKRQWENQMEASLKELKKIHSYFHLSEEKVKKTERFFQATHDEYSRGVRNSSDMVTATQRLLDARKEQLEILRDFQLLKFSLQSMTES